MPAHTHGRGTTEIAGSARFQNYDNNVNFIEAVSGCFTSSLRDVNNTWGVGHPGSSVSGGVDQIYLNFKASGNWTGASESKGSGNTHNDTWTGTKNTHNHTFTGTANTFSLMNPYKTAYCFKRIS